ncbi:MAG: metallophosphoesterase [Candidatus Poribacteria bacterium]
MKGREISMRVFALSDIHMDYNGNVLWLEKLSSIDYTDDVLILAGDISEDLEKLRRVLSFLRNKFAHVFFVPGNHDLWVRRGECIDSIAKFWRVLNLCTSLGVQTQATKVGEAVWIIPLFSWYVKPEEGSDSLFTPKEGEDPTLKMWSDDYFTKWMALEENITVAAFFLRMNEKHLGKHYDAPIITFSHFLPRRDLIFSTQAEATGMTVKDANPSFNFSRVAGCAGLEEQIRRLGSSVHVYGHQHRNRHRLIDGVLYVSHCLGYPRERERGQIRGLGDGPKMIWDSAMQKKS